MNEVLGYLLENCPETVHFVVLTRYEPAFRLEKLRLAGGVARVAQRPSPVRRDPGRRRAAPAVRTAARRRLREQAAGAHRGLAGERRTGGDGPRVDRACFPRGRARRSTPAHGRVLLSGRAGLPEADRSGAGVSPAHLLSRGRVGGARGAPRRPRAPPPANCTSWRGTRCSPSTPDAEARIATTICCATILQTAVRAGRGRASVPGAAARDGRLPSRHVATDQAPSSSFWAPTSSISPSTWSPAAASLSSSAARRSSCGSWVSRLAPTVEARTTVGAGGRRRARHA